MSDKPNHMHNALAALAASIVMCFFGLIYRVVAAPVEHVPLDPNVLEQFPMQIGEWAGEEVPIDVEIREVIDADASVSRRYVRRDGLEAVSMYFPCGTDAGELLQHIPENCYVGAGWTLLDRHPVVLPLADGRRLPASILQFARGGLDVRGLTVFHTLVVDGEYFATFSDVARAKGWHHFRAIRYAAQVQIVASSDRRSVDTSTRSVTDFALAAIWAIDLVFDDLTKK